MLRADNTNWAEYKNALGGVEYFEMYVGPITSLYSQVWWSGLPPVDLPEDIRRRFNDSAMAIIGYEVDQVRRKGDKDVDGSVLARDVSVPINVAYNVRAHTCARARARKHARVGDAGNPLGLATCSSLHWW